MIYSCFVTTDLIDYDRAMKITYTPPRRNRRHFLST